MSNKLVSPIYYVYKLTFKSGKTYIGLHIQKKSNDNYITSSSYYKKHPEDGILLREILIFCKDRETLSFMETWCILSDKAYNGNNNVNHNIGAFVHRMCGSNLGFKFSEETREKIRRKHLGRKLTEKQRKSCSKAASETVWYNNGVISIRIKNTENPPRRIYKRTT